MAYRTVKFFLDCLGTRKPDVILTAIRRGELRAVNIGTGLVRPTWRIDEADFALWLETRAARPPLAKPVRRRKTQSPDVTKFF